MFSNIQPIILAAGKGTRFTDFDGPKVLGEFRGRPMLAYLLETFAKTQFAKPLVVIGYQAEKVIPVIGDKGIPVTQVEQNGTAHAVETALPHLGKEATTVIIAHGDMPFWHAETLEKLVEHHTQTNAVVTATTVLFEDPTGYGRIVRDSSSAFQCIIEEAHTTDQERKITECNAALYAVSRSWLETSIRQIEASEKGEYYLTDIIAVAIKEKAKIETITIPDWREALGINTPEQLRFADQVITKVWFY